MSLCVHWTVRIFTVTLKTWIVKVIRLLWLLLLKWVATTWTGRGKEGAIEWQHHCLHQTSIFFLFTCWTNGSCNVQGGRLLSHAQHMHVSASVIWAFFCVPFKWKMRIIIFFLGHTPLYSSYKRKRFCCTKKAPLIAFFGYNTARYANKSENKIATILGASHTRICIHFYGFRMNFFFVRLLLLLLLCFRQIHTVVAAVTVDGTIHRNQAYNNIYK